MTVSRLDTKRRLVLPRDVVNEYGEEFVIVTLPGEILLKPMPRDPLAALRKEGTKFRGTNKQRLRRAFEKRLRERT